MNGKLLLKKDTAGFDVEQVHLIHEYSIRRVRAGKIAVTGTLGQIIYQADVYSKKDTYLVAYINVIKSGIGRAD